MADLAATIPDLALDADPCSGRSSDPAAHAVRVLAVTAHAWQLGPRTARALARRAAFGYVSRRARLRAAAAIALQPSFVDLAHSW